MQVDQCVLNPLMAIEAKATHVSAHQEMKALAIGPAPEVFRKALPRYLATAFAKRPSRSHAPHAVR